MEPLRAISGPPPSFAQIIDNSDDHQNIHRNEKEKPRQERHRIAPFLKRLSSCYHHYHKCEQNLTNKYHHLTFSSSPPRSHAGPPDRFPGRSCPSDRSPPVPLPSSPGLPIDLPYKSRRRTASEVGEPLPSFESKTRFFSPVFFPQPFA